MATRVFVDEELERLRAFPEITREELFRFFTLTQADIAFIAPGRGRGPADRLGVAVALCTLPWLGFVPDTVASAPPVAVARLADQLNINAAELRSYGRRAQTRTEHLQLVARYLGWRPPGAMEWKDLEEFLLSRAMEHDSPTLLFRLACEYLISARVIRPGPVTLVERVAHARQKAQEQTYDRLAHEFTPQRCRIRHRECGEHNYYRERWKSPRGEERGLDQRYGEHRQSAGGAGNHHRCSRIPRHSGADDPASGRCMVMVSPNEQPHLHPRTIDCFTFVIFLVGALLATADASPKQSDVVRARGYVQLVQLRHSQCRRPRDRTILQARHTS